MHLALAHGALAGRAPAAEACLRLLLAADVSPAQADEVGRTGVATAAALGLSPALEMLLSAPGGSDVVATPDKRGATPLHLAARGCHCGCVAALLRAGGAGPDGAALATPDDDGATPLHAAAHAGCAPCCTLLLSAPNGSVAAALRDSRGRTPAEIASRRGHVAAAAALGCDPSSVAAAVPHGPTVVLSPPGCAGHRTHSQASASGRGEEEPPPENERRLDVLLHAATGSLRASEFGGTVPRVPCLNAVAIDDATDKPAQLGDVLRVHEWAYVQRLQQAIGRVPPHAVGSLDGDTAVAAASYAAALSAAGAVIDAIDRVVGGSARNAFCAVRPPGHHAGPFGPVSPTEPPGSGSHGFCLLNNVAIGAAYALCVHRARLRRVAIVDFDGARRRVLLFSRESTAVRLTRGSSLVASLSAVHHGNGTEAIVEATVAGSAKLPFSTVAASGTLRVPTCKPWRGEGDCGDVFFASVHGYGRGFYPGTGPTTDTGAHTGGALSIQIASERPEWAQDGVIELPPPFGGAGGGGAPGGNSTHARGAPRVVDVGMAGAGPKPGRGAAWRRVWAGRILPQLAAFAPDLLLISAGFDAHAKDDIQGPVNLGVTEDDYEWLTDQLVAISNATGGRVVSVLEGGYRVHGGCASAFGRSVAAHVRGLARPSSALYDAAAERAALEGFWAARREAQARAAEAEAAQRLAAAEADAAAAAEAAEAAAEAAVAGEPFAPHQPGGDDGGGTVAPASSLAANSGAAAAAAAAAAASPDAGGHRKRARAPVDYAALSAQLQAEAAAAAAARGVPAQSNGAGEGHMDTL